MEVLVKTPTRKEIIEAVKNANIITERPVHMMKSIELIQLLKWKRVEERNTKGIKMVKPGRPVDPNSVRQKRLADLEARRSEGRLHEGKTGRPVDPNSVRQKRLADLEARRKEGRLHEGKTGRPVDPNSARQKRLAAAKQKRLAAFDEKLAKAVLKKELA